MQISAKNAAIKEISALEIYVVLLLLKEYLSISCVRMECLTGLRLILLELMEAIAENFQTAGCVPLQCIVDMD